MSHDPNAKMEDLVKEGDDLDLVVVKTNDQEGVDTLSRVRFEAQKGMKDVSEAAENGTLEEAWGTGTAAVISPIGALGWGDKCYEINHNRIGELSQKLYDELTGIQWGTKPDPFGWTCPVC